MSFLPRLAVVPMTALLASPALQAASFAIDSFGASATSVKVGDTVDFWVQFSASTTSWSSGGSNPHPPEPAEGTQYWDVNWYQWEFETLRSVWLQAGGASFHDTPALPAGASYGNSWSFSITFDTAGVHGIDLSGGWEVDIDTGYSGESAWRDCYYTDYETSTGLTCGWWNWEYNDYWDQYTTGDSVSGGALSITVSAVPEPGTWALGLAGAAVLAARGGFARRHRRQAGAPR